MSPNQTVDIHALPGEDIADRLRLALDAANMGDWSWDAKTNMVSFSRKAAEIFGIDADGILNWADIKEHLYHEDREQAFMAVKKAIAAKSIYNVEYRINHTNGELRWISVKGKPVFDSSGTLIKIVAVLHDITDKKLIDQKNADYQKKILESEARNRQLADAMPQLVWTTTEGNGFINHYNNQSRHYTLDPSEHKEIIIHPDDIEATTAAWKKSLETLTRYQCEHRIQMADGTYRRHLSRATPVKDPETGLVTWFGTATDTEDLYNLQDELIVVQESLGLAMLSGKMGWWIRDTVTDEVEFSPEMGNMFGLDPGEFRGTKEHYFEMLNFEDTINNQVIIDDAIKRHTNFTIEFRFRHKNGSWGWMEGRGRVYQSKWQKNPHLYGIAIDITDRKMAEVRLMEAKALAEEANNAKSDFLANMSHELRTPLNAVVGMTDILADSAPLTEDQKKYIGTLKVSSGQLLGLIDDLLDVAKLESFSMVLEKTPFYLNEIISTVVTINKVKADKKELTLEVAENFDPSLQLLGDPLRLKQILMNLVGNAVKFTPKGVVRFNIQSTPTFFPDLVQFTFSVSDTGIGINSEHLDTIFSKFSQGETSMARRFGGSGLGLHIAKSFVDLMGGSIHVTSTMGQGTEFVVTLSIPIYTEATARPDPVIAEPAKEENGQSFHVLLVEDYEPNIIVAGYFIEEFGGSYDVAKTGLEAIEKSQSGSYDLILMDVQMPQMNGYDATKQIRLAERDQGRMPVPIIGMTANALKGDKEKCIEAGMNDYISKPFERRDLSMMIEHYTGSKTAE